MTTRRASGQLIHEDAIQKPLYGLSVELWDRDTLVDDRLGSATTDRDGRFDIEYNPADAGRLERGLPDLELRVFDRPRESADVAKARLLIKIAGPDNVAAAAFNFGRVRVPHWEYDHSFPFPSVLKSSYTDELPQSFAKGYLGYLALHNAGVLLESVALRARAMLGGGSSPSLTKIQGKFARTLSEELSADKRNSDEFFVYRTLNGFNPAMLCVDGNDESSYFVEVNWDQDESDHTHDISNVKLYLSLRDGTLAPTRISIAIREQSETAPGSPIGKTYDLSPQDADWESAKRVFRSAWAASGELDTHLCAGHLNVAQYAIAAFRNFEQSPLCGLLFPHLRSVININDVGKTEIFGTQGVLTTNTPLTTNAAWSRLARHLGTLDWSTWSPRAPRYDGHTYAKAANIFWKVVSEYVTEFFEDNLPAISEYWYEVERFSEDVVKHSVSYQPALNYASWYDRSEGDNSETGRETVEGKLRAVRRISMNPQEPEAGESDKLRQACCYMIFHATFLHTWANDLQLTDLGNVGHTSLGLRNGSMGPLSDPTILPPPLESITQLKFCQVLSTSKRGTLISNEYGDVPQAFIDKLNAVGEEYAALGNEFELKETFDVDTIRSRINI